MGAWIETGATAIIVLIVSVAPYMGAWIETLSQISEKQFVGRTLYGCVD